jgi:hypothetical protein
MTVAEAACCIWQKFGFENREKISQYLNDNICILFYLLLILCLYPSPVQLRPIDLCACQHSAAFDKVQSRCRDNNVYHVKKIALELAHTVHNNPVSTLNKGIQSNH